MATAAKAPDVYELAEAFREELLALDAKALSKMAAAYRQGYKRMFDRMQAVAQLIADAQQKGQPVDPAWLFQHERWQQAYNAIRDELAAYKKAASGIVTDAQGEAIELGSEHMQGLMKASLGSGPGLGFSFGTVDDDAVRAMVGMASKGGPIARLFESMVTDADIADRARHILTQGAVLGTNPGVIARQLRGPLAIPMWRAQTIARTETMRAYREAQRQNVVANESLLEGWVWVAAKDARTCEVCWANDGKLFPIRDATASEAVQMTGHQAATVPTDTGVEHGPAVVQKDTGQVFGPAVPAKKKATSIAEIEDGDDVVAVMSAKYPQLDWSSWSGRKLRVGDARETLAAFDDVVAKAPWAIDGLTTARLQPPTAGSSIAPSWVMGEFAMFSSNLDAAADIASFYSGYPHYKQVKPASVAELVAGHHATSGDYSRTIRGMVARAYARPAMGMLDAGPLRSAIFKAYLAAGGDQSTFLQSAIAADIGNLQKVIQFGPIRTVKGASVQTKMEDLWVSLFVGEDHGPKKTGALEALFAVGRGTGSPKVGVAPAVKKPSKIKQLLGVIKPQPTKPFGAGPHNKWLSELDQRSETIDGQSYYGAGLAKRRIQIDLTRRIREDDERLEAIADSLLDHDADWQRGDTYKRGLRNALNRVRHSIPGLSLNAKTIDWQALGIAEPPTDAYADDDMMKQWFGRLTTQQRAAVLRQIPDDWDENPLGKYVSDRVQGWAVTSMDSQPSQVAMQMAAHDEFQLKSSMGHVRWDEIYRTPTAMGGRKLRDVTDEWYAKHGKAYRAFLRSMYENTQEQFQRDGIKTVRLARGTGSSLGNTLKAGWYPDPQGMWWVDPNNPQGGGGSIQHPGWVRGDRANGVDPRARVKMQPMSSFSSQASVARRFGSYVSYADVPADWIIGTARTGYGCLNEREWVVLSMDDEWDVWMVAR